MQPLFPVTSYLTRVEAGHFQNHLYNMGEQFVDTYAAYTKLFHHSDNSEKYYNINIKNVFNVFFL